MLLKEALRAVPPSDLDHGVTTAHYKLPTEGLNPANQEMAIDRPRYCTRDATTARYKLPIEGLMLANQDVANDRPF